MQTKPATLYEENQGVIGLIQNPKLHLRTKQIDIKFPHVRVVVENKVVKVEYCPKVKLEMLVQN